MLEKGAFLDLRAFLWDPKFHTLSRGVNFKPLQRV